MDNWIGEVSNNNGIILENFQQKRDFERGGGGACIPLSILWFRHQLISEKKPKEFKDLVKNNTKHDRLIDNIQRKVSDSDGILISKWKKKLSSQARMKSYIDYWFSDRKINNALEALDDERRKCLLNLYETSDEIVDGLPNEIVQILNEYRIRSPDRVIDFKRMLRDSVVDNPPERIESISELIKYRSLNKLVNLNTKNLFEHKEDKGFVNADKIIDSLGCYSSLSTLQLLCLYRLEYSEDKRVLRDFLGHIMAIYYHESAIQFFDPNYGIVKFTKESEFQEWFTNNWKTQYGKAFGDGAVLKTFVPNPVSYN